MKKMFIKYTILSIMSISLLSNNFLIDRLSNINLNKESTHVFNDEDLDYKNNLKRDLLVLMMAYDEIKDIEVNDEYVYIILNDGKKVLYDDKKQKSKEGKISNCDIQDSLETIYPLNEIDDVLDIDPGRGRPYELLNYIYGSGRDNIEKNLQNTSTKCGNLRFNKNGKALESLKKALDESYALMQSDKSVGGYIFPISGTFNYRVIQGTGRLSAHAYGIAIDLKRDDADYWKWANKSLASKRIKNYPKELVKVFENNGFVWGGKWEHFDILHFEYRPEIILKSKYFGDDSKTNKDVWHQGAADDERVKNIINLIENKQM